MKKAFYTLVFVLAVGFTLGSCTEDEIKPQDSELSNGGGSGDVGKF